MTAQFSGFEISPFRNQAKQLKFSQFPAASCAASFRSNSPRRVICVSVDVGSLLDRQAGVRWTKTAIAALIAGLQKLESWKLESRNSKVRAGRLRCPWATSGLRLCSRTPSITGQSD